MPHQQHPEHRSFGVFKPVGHVLVQLPGLAEMAGGGDAVRALGIAADDLVRYTPDEMIRQIDNDLQTASPLAALGQELNLIKAHRVMAEQGYHFLVVKVANLEQAREVAVAVQPWGAARAQYYGHFLIEELIAHPDDTTQVSESPARGLDAQTPSGEEADRSARPVV